MGPHIAVASANVLYSLGPADARRALGDVLDLAPDLIGLQEWYPSRFQLLRETGRLGLVPQIGGRSRRRTARGTPEYLWNMPLVGGCAVGARADRFELDRCRTRFLSGVGPGPGTDASTSPEPSVPCARSMTCTVPGRLKRSPWLPPRRTTRRSSYADAKTLSPPRSPKRATVLSERMTGSRDAELADFPQAHPGVRLAPRVSTNRPDGAHRPRSAGCHSH